MCLLWSHFMPPCIVLSNAIVISSPVGVTDPLDGSAKGADYSDGCSSVSS